jgi:peptidoglycan lytic transglycosylase
MTISIGSTLPTLEELPAVATRGIPPNSPRNSSFPQLLETKLSKTALSAEEPGQTTIEYIVQPGDTLWKLGVKKFQADPYQIARDNGIKNPDRIYPGQKLMIRKEVNPGSQEVTASWYGADYHNKPTASGERFDMYKNTLAHKTLPLGTTVRLTNPKNGARAVAKINDRGPFISGRDVDLSYGLARKLDLVTQGVGTLKMEIL